MSLESVRAFFAEKAPDITVIESPVSTATVALAAEAYGVEPARIAKTLSLRIGERVVLIVTSGTSRMDNKKVKARFGGKPKMLGLDEVAGIIPAFGRSDSVLKSLRRRDSFLSDWIDSGGRRWARRSVYGRISERMSCVGSRRR